MGEMRGELQGLKAFWESRRRGRLVPARSDFLPEEFKGWMRHLAVFDVERDPQRFFSRLTGTKLVEYEGRDPTGFYLDEIVETRVFGLRKEDFGRCVSERQPVFTHHVIRRATTGEATFDRLLMPLAGDGETVDKLLMALYVDDPLMPQSTGRDLYAYVA